MKTLTYKCTLLTDVVLNAKSATEGTNITLDFIPGNNFLGIVASSLYARKDAHTAWLMFHSGKVRYGDAHPLVLGHRSVKAPMSMYYPKLKSVSEECFVYHALPQPLPADVREKQLKQLRTGFYAFTPRDEAFAARTMKSFSVKSAHDRDRGCSKDGCMYGYEALRAGTALAFTIAFDDDVDAALIAEIDQALRGTKHLGKSRTAQYGLVEITPCRFTEAHGATTGRQLMTVYADSRLVFFDDCGMPTFRPTAEQLHLPEGSTVCWELSQIRTFRYAPWNYKRQAYDTDRCGIEKGSVLVVKSPSPMLQPEAYVGAYNTEGFGHVIYNPDFLKATSDGHSAMSFHCPAGESVADAATGSPERGIPHTLLLDMLSARCEERRNRYAVYECVNRFVTSYAARFRGKAFASQWGTIRSIAMSQPRAVDLKDALFAESRGYLTHGVAKEKWAEKGRRQLLDDFCENLPDELLQQALVNLASEMAKAIKA